jgi:hypothetical protein
MIAGFYLRLVTNQQAAGYDGGGLTMGWLPRLLSGRRPLTRRAQTEENESAIRRAELAYEIVCKATEMHARGVPLPKIRIALIKIAQSKGFKNTTLIENLETFELHLDSKHKVIFDGAEWESVTDLS